MCASVLQWRAHAMKDCVASLHQSQAQAEVHDQLLRHVEDAQGRHHGHTELLVLLDGQRVPLLLELLVGKILHCTERKTTATERKTCKPPTLIKPPRFTRSGLVAPLGPYSYRCIACGKCAWMSKTHNENELPHFFKKKTQFITWDYLMLEARGKVLFWVVPFWANSSNSKFDKKNNSFLKKIFYRFNHFGISFVILGCTWWFFVL